MSQGKRYKFQGSAFQVKTSDAATKAITAATATNPVVLTVTAHGYVDGDVVLVAGVVGMVELNGNSYVVEATTANSLTLVNVDGTGYTAYVSGGTTAAAVMSEFCELKSFNQQDSAANQIDVTTICSTAKEFETGLSDADSLSLEYNYAGAEVVQAAIRAAKLAGTIIPFRILLPNSGGTLVMFGSVQQQGISAGVDDVYKGTATIKLSGEVYVLD